MLLKVSALFIFNIAAIFIAMFVLGLKVNISKSYPLGIYQRIEGEISKGVLVEACLPESVSKFMVKRSYIPDNGSCGGYPPVIKTVFGVEGDRIEVGERVSINGVTIVNTNVEEYDSKKQKLTAAENTLVEKGHVWLMSTYNHKSYDARYFGQIPINHVRSAIRPLWTL